MIFGLIGVTYHKLAYKSAQVEYCCAEAAMQV